MFEDDDDATVGNEDDRMTERHRAIIRKAEYHCGAFDVPVLTAHELIALREKDDAKVIVVDVRTEAERRVARLPRSVSRCYFEKALRLNADAASLLRRRRALGPPRGAVGPAARRHAALRAEPLELAAIHA